MNNKKALYAAGGIFSLFVVVYIGNLCGLDKNSWPAWVQALGSIAAIFVAIFVMDRQSKSNIDLAKKLRFEEIGKRLEVIEALIEGAYDVVRVMETHTEEINNWYDYGYSVLDPEKARSAVNSLKAIPLHAMGSYNLVISISDMIDALEKLEPLIVFHLAQNDVHYVFEDEQKSQVKHFCKLAKEARELTRNSIIELGHTPKTKE